MTDGVRPIPPVGERDRRAAQRRDAAERRVASASRALVVATLPVVDSMPDPASPADPIAPADLAAAFSAQLMGQKGQRRGLKAGPPLMNSARASYLGNEYSGENDRRPPSGLVKKTDI
ncbi:hypothetical protein BZG35_16015 [Brevundimonas sp. LM2]|uniref:hypothetical protein n=1 Tax=Brevundimonas sp. LM2 TaxID=1938605 RepID=UPI000983B0DC|nr:hypothetical protein [Brevundimonas sp. LM2]AQR62995.1 hypothetical protein BZG35_16015 [Brevundimonas sp. LM2]